MKFILSIEKFVLRDFMNDQSNQVDVGNMK